MLTLFIKPGCPYCANVLHAAEELGLEPDVKSIYDDGVAEELIAAGGKLQMPYLIDHEHDVSMYESGDIIDYLHRTFGMSP
ncbi:MAG TPA: glutathione S-transferase N-terminal domain-containing protein [Candidatus Paceibacterota bacterium]|nr:glutathione S-transferase N-terminal domain-containing protein [Candidatus Paceibacterota bacterium]